MKEFITFFLICELFFGIQLCYAESDTSKIYPSSQNQNSEFAFEVGENSSADVNYISMISSLLTVILLILLFAWVYKKFVGVSAEKLLSGKIKEAKENSISVLTTTPIGQNKFLHLIEVRGQKLLIGSTSNDIVMLKEISNKHQEGGI